MVRYGAIRRLTATLLLAGSVAVAAAGCVLAPVPLEPVAVYPAPVVVAPRPVIIGPRVHGFYRGGYRGGYGGGYGHYR